MVVIDQRGARLEHQKGALIVRIPEQRPHSIPLKLIDQLVVAASVQIESSLLTQLAERGIGVIAMPGRGHRRSAYLYGSGHGDAKRRLGQYRQVTNERIRLQWARRFVCFKISGNLRLIRRAQRQRSEFRLAFTQAVEALSSAYENVQRADSRETLRGIEGAASASFFHAYRVLFAPELHFTRRNRRPPRDPVNAALSLGYTLVHGEAVRVLAQAGLDPMLGFLHDPAYNRESLACDFVEFARPRVERLVWQLFAEQQLRGEQFSQDGGASRMNKAARRAFFAAYEHQAGLHRRWFGRYAQVIVRTCTQSFSTHAQKAG